MKLDYSINLTKPQNDPDFNQNIDTVMDMQQGLQNDLAGEGQSQAQPSAQPAVAPNQPVVPGQKQVMPQ
jgi:hypothetical protein